MTRGTVRSNEVWIAELSACDEQALTDLRDYLIRAVAAWLGRCKCLSHLSHYDKHQLAEDFTQEAMLQVLDNLGKFEGRSKFTSWVYPIVINLARTELRRNRWQTGSLEEDGVPVADDQPLGFMPQPGPSPEEELVRERVLHAVKELIESDLSPRQREVVMAQDVAGLSGTETATQLGISASAVYKHTCIARQRLRSGLKRRGWTKREVLGAFS